MEELIKIAAHHNLGTCFHDLPETMDSINEGLTLKWDAISLRRLPFLLMSKIIRILFSVNLLALADEPLGSLPFFAASRALSNDVPINKCSGLKQGGLSHLWQMKRGLLKSKSKKTYAESLCTFTRIPQIVVIPYPRLSRCPVHIQQLVAASILLFEKSLDFILNLLKPLNLIILGFKSPLFLIL